VFGFGRGIGYCHKPALIAIRYLLHMTLADDSRSDYRNVDFRHLSEASSR
jgi:hypothetical protein